jgi:AcrR family transcriptional regulator
MVADQLRGLREGLGASATDRAGVERMIREYLSPDHRDNREAGCPSAALLDEIGRLPDATKEAYTEGVLAFIDDIAAVIAPQDPKSARVKTLSIYAMMVGTIQLSRAMSDRQLADQILEQGIQNALAALAATQEN